jgi:hypothetical protein
MRGRTPGACTSSLHPKLKQELQCGNTLAKKPCPASSTKERERTFFFPIQTVDWLKQTFAVFRVPVAQILVKHLPIHPHKNTETLERCYFFLKHSFQHTSKTIVLADVDDRCKRPQFPPSRLTTRSEFQANLEYNFFV